MTTTNQIKIEALENELFEQQKKINEYHCKMEALMKEVVQKETGKKQRDEELIERENQLEALKSTIPNFDEETCKLYIKYYEMKTDYKKTIEFYKEIDKRTEKKKEEISSMEYCINDIVRRIEYIKNALKEAQKEELANKEN